ncbi:MAG: hypothetical protein JRE65_02200 [Deltaproteobacteria bacterium]|jgi:hypothetical protein|nr:hypothetical protein [Deltaproteobacteria bacterium]
MKHEHSMDWFDGGFQIFGTMDGVSIVKWAVKVVNSFDIDVYCRLYVGFLDRRGKRIKVSEQWKWYANAYSKNRYVQSDAGFKYLIKKNGVQEISGVVKITYPEAGSISEIDFHILQETF